MFDVLIIGCGVVGASLAYELSRFDIQVCVLEGENDVATGTTKANSAIIHSGYDPRPGSLMAKLNVASVPLTKEICEKLDVLYKQIGSLTVGFGPEDDKTIEKLYKRGVENGVPFMEILKGAALKAREPLLSENASSALWAPTAAIVSPWELCLAMAQTAVANGVELHLNSHVSAIEKQADFFTVKTEKSEFRARCVVNAAGVYSDVVHNLIAKPSFTIKPHSGQYYLLDKSECHRANSVIFQCPVGDTKGVLVAPTVHGNLIVGPDNTAAEKDGLETTLAGLDFVRTTAQRSIPSISFRENIRNFAGVRAISDVDDFIIGEAGDVPGFFDIAGIKSPGLSAAAAIGVYARELLQKHGIKMNAKSNFTDSRRKLRFDKLSLEGKKAAIAENPLYARVICRCETITEGEIMDCFNEPIPPVSIDGVKRRVGTGSGRCQGGFCGPRVLEILARERKIPPEQVPMDKEGTFILSGKTKEVQ